MNLNYTNGIIYALLAYMMWGVAPIYFKALGEVPAEEILMHRVIWSCLFVLGLLLLTGGIHKVKALLKQPKKLLILLITSITIAANWLVFIWAIANERMIEASLGYYINPLLNVVVGMVFLGERLSKMQASAVAFAAIGVLIPMVQFGSIPIVSLLLASTFSAYGLLRKQVAVDSLTGLFIETLFLLPVALIFWWQLDNGFSTEFSSLDLSTILLLLSAGIVTTLPLLCFAKAALSIPFFVLGFLQYIGPSLMLLLATLVYGEAFSTDKIITFGFIWLGLVIFSFDLLQQLKLKRKTA